MDPVDAGLPHREPFIFVDDVFAVEPGVSAEGVVTFGAENPVFRGHFPGDPVVPGVLLTEALAQVSGVAAAAGEPGRRFLLAAIRQMKFPAAARPDERITLRARADGAVGGLWRFDVRASAGDRTVAEGQIVLSG